jgi:hypothetical protein
MLRNWGIKCGFLSEYCSRDRGWGFIAWKVGYGRIFQNLIPPKV